jgi:hypothetical protein
VADLDDAVVGGGNAWASTCSPSEEASTAKPWLWLVISTTPSARRSTGWFTPR